MRSTTKKTSGAELRAIIEQRRLADPKAEAQHHEALFLKGIGSAQAEFDWLVEHAAWTELGFESVVDWWDQRVRPVMVQLEMRPTAEMVDRILGAVREVERALPPAQRRTQRELASLALASDWKVRGRNDPRNRRSAAGADLEKPIEENKETSPASASPGNGEEGTTHLGGPAVPSNPQTAVEPLVSTDGDDDTTSTPPAAGVGASTQGEADRPTPAVNPKDSSTEEQDPVDHPALAEPGAAEDEGPEGGESSDAAGVGVPAAQTGTEGLPPTQSDPVDGREQQGLSGVLEPAALGPVELLEELAEKYEALDVDVLGPLMTSAELAALSTALDRVVNIVELLTRWHERTHA